MRSAFSIVLATTEPPSWDMFTNLGASLLEGLVLLKHKAVTVLDYRKPVTITNRTPPLIVVMRPTLPRPHPPPVPVFLPPYADWGGFSRDPALDPDRSEP